MHFNLLLKERYSVRDYKPLKVSKALITQVLEAGRMAPSANNQQPWYFISVCENDQLDRIKKAYPREWFSKVPQVIVICGDHDQAWKRSYDNKDHCDIDVAIAVDHMTLRAAELGLGTCWVCHFDPKVVSEILELPGHIEPMAILPIGYPSNPGVPLKKRKSSEEVFFKGKFGQPYDI
jgi:nitroreductase